MSEKKVEVRKCMICHKTLTDETRGLPLCPKHKGKGKTVMVGGATLISLGAIRFILKIVKR